MGRDFPTQRALGWLGLGALLAAIATGLLIKGANGPAIAGAIIMGLAMVIIFGGVTIVIGAVIERRPVVVEAPVARPVAAPTARAFAVRHGLGYRPAAETAFTRRLPHLPGVPVNATLTEIIEGEYQDRRIIGLQAEWAFHTGQFSVPMRRTVYLVDAPEQWPTLRIRPRSASRGVVRMLRRGRGLHLENERFNRRFDVQTVDDEFAVCLLSPELQAFVLEKTGVAWKIADGFLMIAYPGAMRADRIHASLDRLLRFRDLVPEELEWWEPRERAAW